MDFQLSIWLPPLLVPHGVTISRSLDQVVGMHDDDRKRQRIFDALPKQAGSGCCYLLVIMVVVVVVVLVLLFSFFVVPQRSVDRCRWSLSV